MQNSVPVVVGSTQGGGNFQQLQPNFGYDEGAVDPNQAFSFHDVGVVDADLDPVPFEEVFPDDAGSGQNDLGNYLSNLDLSNT